MTDAPDVVEVIITGPRDFIGPHTTKLIDDHLIACAQVANINSTYRWEGRVEHEDEARATMHTTRANVAAVSEFTRHEHPYDVPCILVIPVESGDPDYMKWVCRAVEEASNGGRPAR